MISPWITLGLLFGFVVIGTWLGRNLTPTRLMNLQARGLSARGSGEYDDGSPLPRMNHWKIDRIWLK